MANLADVCDAYGISKSTALRRIKECFGSVPKQGNSTHLDASEMQILADYLAKHDIVKSRENDSGDASEVTQLRIDLARSEERVASLTRECDALRRELDHVHAETERLHEALAREQASHVGFFRRLGQKLLGDGS